MKLSNFILRYLPFFLLSIFMIGCEDDGLDPLNTNYVTFSDDSYSIGVDPNDSVDFDVTLYTANTTGSDRTFDVEVDASGAVEGTYEVPNTVVVPANSNEGKLTVTLTDDNLGISVSNITFSLVPTLELSTGAPATLSYFQTCTEVTGSLDFVFDGYPEEVGWQITDALGGVVDSRDPGVYADLTTVSTPVTLCSGRDYTLTITDTYGDGLSFPNIGTYTLTIEGTEVASGGGNYGSSDSTSFTTD